MRSGSPSKLSLVEENTNEPVEFAKPKALGLKGSILKKNPKYLVKPVVKKTSSFNFGANSLQG